MTKTKEEKLQVLVQLAELFNEHEIQWAVGGSLLLYFKGLVSDFHDLDLMIDEQAGEQVAQLLEPLGTRRPFIPSPAFQTRCFMEFLIEGVEIDVIGGLAIVSEGHVHELPLRSEEIEEGFRLEGQRIPLHSLRVWEIYYTLMGRTEKAEILRRAQKKAIF